MPTVIRFYRVGDAYGAFSNFSPHAIFVDGRLWPTSEHYFQAHKFAEGSVPFLLILDAETPNEAARLGRSRSFPLRAGWEDIKLDVMRAALRAKAEQHVDFRDLLLRTGDAHLVEHTRNDRFWADGGDGSGQNWLGRLLMQLRDDLRR